MVNEEFLKSLATDIPGDKLCELACMYGIASELTESDTAKHLAHLLHDHDCIEAAELMLAMMRFSTYSHQREQEIFKASGVTHEGCFSPEDDVAITAEVEAHILELRTERAAAESAGATKH